MPADPSLSIPFTIEELPHNRCVLHFDEVVESLKPYHRQQLEDLLSRRDAILVDMSRTNVLTSGWLRFLCTLTVVATESGKVLAICGIGANIATCAEAIEVMDCLIIKRRAEWEQA